MRLEVTMRLTIGLGNGTRERGEVLGYVSLHEGRTVADLLAAAYDDLELPADIELVEGVDRTEMNMVLRNQHLVDFVAPTPVDASPDGDSPEDAAHPVNLFDRTVSSLELDEQIKERLTAANLHTVGDVIDYGADNEGLTSIEGIGKSSEKKIQAAIQALDS